MDHYDLEMDFELNEGLEKEWFSNLSFFLDYRQVYSYLYLLDAWGSDPLSVKQQEFLSLLERDIGEYRTLLSQVHINSVLEELI